MKFMQIKPQKARGKFTESMWADLAWAAENKYDGDRRIAQFIHGSVRFTGTRESVDGTGYVEKSENIPRLSGMWTGPMSATEISMGRHQRTHNLDGTILDGEIVAPWAKDLPGGESKWVTSIMGSSPEKAIALQRAKGWLEYRVFDCLWFKSRDVRMCPLYERQVFAAKILKEWKNECAKFVDGAYDEDAKRTLWELAREGLIFKHDDHTYGNERLWVKLKKSWTADVVITKYQLGKGKYMNQIGALEFSQFAPWPNQKAPRMVPMGTCSGFDDALRAKMTKAFHKYMGKVIEIEHNGREPTGAFRHPRFKRFRPDKSPKDCVYREDET